MMLEGLARIRVEEAIRTGLKEQHTRRNLPPESRPNLMGHLRILVLVLTITILSTGCSAIAGTTSSDELEPVTESGPSRFTITMTPEKIDIPADIPAGRFLFDPRLENTAYVIVDPVWRNWGAPRHSGVSCHPTTATKGAGKQRSDAR